NPDGGRTTYSYDPVNRLEAQVLPTGEIYTSQYDPNGNVTTLLYGTGSQRAQFDALNRPITQIAFNGANAISTLIDAYDAGGRKVSQTRDGTATLYSYDDVNRLTGQQASGARATFAYDDVGNQTLKHHEGSQPVTMAYDAASRQVTIQDGP